MFSLTTTMWVCGRHRVRMKPGLCLAGKSPRSTHLDPRFHTSVSSPTLCHTHRPSTHVSRGLFVQSIPAWRFPSTLKSPPQQAKLPPPPARIRWAGGRGPICFIAFVLILQSVSPGAEFVVVLYACCFWSAGKPGWAPLRDAVISATSLQRRPPHLLALAWTISSLPVTPGVRNYFTPTIIIGALRLARKLVRTTGDHKSSDYNNGVNFAWMLARQNASGLQ